MQYCCYRSSASWRPSKCRKCPSWLFASRPLVTRDQTRSLGAKRGDSCTASNCPGQDGPGDVIRESSRNASLRVATVASRSRTDSALGLNIFRARRRGPRRKRARMRYAKWGGRDNVTSFPLHLDITSDLRAPSRCRMEHTADRRRGTIEASNCSNMVVIEPLARM